MTEKVKSYEMAVVCFFLTEAQFFLYGLNGFTKTGGRSTIISMILGGILGFLFLKLTLNKKEFTLKKKALFFLVPFLLLNLTYTLNKTIHFIYYNVVGSISYYLLTIVFILLVIFSVKRGVKTLTRSAFIYLVTTIFLFLITFVSLFFKMDFTNVLPLMDSSWKIILKSALVYFLIAVSPYFYLVVFDRKINKEDTKFLLRGYTMTHIFHVFNTLIIFSILGLELINIYPYPEISIFKKVSFLNIIDRMETIFSLSYFLSLFVMFTISFTVLHKFVMYFLKTKKEGISLLILASIVFFLAAVFQTPISREAWIITLIANSLFFLFTGKSSTS